MTAGPERKTNSDNAEWAELTIEDEDIIRTTPEAEPEGHVGELIRALRTRQRMSGEELAQRLGVTRSAVSHWELGRRTPPSTPHFAHAILDALNPSEADREMLLELLVGHDSVNKDSFSDRHLYEELLARTDRLRDLGATVLALQAEYDSELVSIRSILHNEIVRSTQGGEDEEPEMGMGTL